jgi:hypothetical protein
MSTWDRTLTFLYDCWQVYLYDANRVWSEEYNEFLVALDDAGARGLSVGLADGLVDIFLPRKINYSAPLRIEGSEAPPPLDDENWDHIIEFPLHLPTGTLVLDASGGLGQR